MIEEYKTLREEILQKIEIHNTLVRFNITTTVAILAFAFSQDNCYIFLLPFFIIIPVSIRDLYYRRAMYKLSAYIIVFIESNNEDLNWETRNSKLSILNNSSKKSSLKNFFDKILNYDNFILSIFCLILYYVYYLSDEALSINSLNFYLNILLPFVLIIIEFIISINGKLYKQQPYWINEWIKLKAEENTR